MVGIEEVGSGTDSRETSVSETSVSRAKDLPKESEGSVVRVKEGRVFGMK